VFGIELGEAAVEAVAFAEFCYGVGAAVAWAMAVSSILAEPPCNCASSCDSQLFAFLQMRIQRV
jgi:hypothetical protein